MLHARCVGESTAAGSPGCPVPCAAISARDPGRGFNVAVVELMSLMAGRAPVGSVVGPVRLRGGAVRDILNTITKWWAADETFGLATVVGTFRSAPRDPGAALAVEAAAR